MNLLAVDARGVQLACAEPGGTWSVARVWSGGRGRCVAVHPEARHRAWVGTDEGVLRSDDGGRTWTRAGALGRPVTAIAPDPTDPDTVYAGTRPVELHVSRDGGGTWTELEALRRARRWYWRSPAEPPSLDPFVLGLSVSPADPDLVVVGIEAGAVLRSTDGGRSWSTHRRKADLDCHALTFHARDGAWVYEAGGGGPACSRDGGDSWVHPLAGLRGRYCTAVAADAERPEVWYVAAAPTVVLPHVWRMPTVYAPGHAHAAIYRSSGGGPWERLTGGLPQPLDHTPFGLLAPRAAPGELVLGLSDGRVWQGTEYGDAWRPLPFRFEGIRRLAEA